MVEGDFCEEEGAVLGVPPGPQRPAGPVAPRAGERRCVDLTIVECAEVGVNGQCREPGLALGSAGILKTVRDSHGAE